MKIISNDKLIKRNAKIGAHTVIMPGVTISSQNLFSATAKLPQIKFILLVNYFICLIR